MSMSAAVNVNECIAERRCGCETCCDSKDEPKFLRDTASFVCQETSSFGVNVCWSYTCPQDAENMAGAGYDP